MVHQAKTHQIVFVDDSRSCRSPGTLLSVLASMALLGCAFGGAGFWLWVLYKFVNWNVGGGFRFLALLGVVTFLSIGLFAVAAVFSFLRAYLFRYVVHTVITSDGIRRDKTFWEWSQVRGIDLIDYPNIGIARILVHTKRGWCVGALTLSVHLANDNARGSIVALHDFLEKNVRHLNWREWAES
jgi:hypothetical protein